MVVCRNLGLNFDQFATIESVSRIPRRHTAIRGVSTFFSSPPPCFPLLDWRPWLPEADWCLQSNGVPDYRPFIGQLAVGDRIMMVNGIRMKNKKAENVYVFLKIFKDFWGVCLRCLFACFVLFVSHFVWVL